MKIIQFLTNAFPIWILISSIIALFYPATFTWVTKEMTIIGLGIIMLGMGLTITVEDFKRILTMPKLIFLGVLLQYTLMPFLGWGIGYLFQLPNDLAIGLILVASCPGGTASNVISFLARVSVPLSVTMTTLSTLFSVVLTPLLTTFLVGNRIEVNTLGLFYSTVKVVILPVALGLFLNRYVPNVTKKIVPFAPLTAVIAIVLIVASIVGLRNKEIIEAGFRLILSVFTLHTLGFVLGYLFSYRVSKKIIYSRTVSIEVGMQNSGLGVVLAQKNFAAFPLVAVPSAISSVFHSLIGSFLAVIWRNSSGKESVKRHTR